jgi:hypothetical protein
MQTKESDTTIKKNIPNFPVLATSSSEHRLKFPHGHSAEQKLWKEQQIQLF